MAPKRAPRKPPIPNPPPSEFLGNIPKKKTTSAASAARAAGGARPKEAKTQEVRGDKRQRNSSGSSANDPKKLRDGGKFDPKGEAVPLGGHRQPPPSPTTSVSTVQSETTEGGPVEDREVGDELEEIKARINQMKVKPMPLASQVCN